MKRMLIPMFCSIFAALATFWFGLLVIAPMGGSLITTSAAFGLTAVTAAVASLTHAAVSSRLGH